METKTQLNTNVTPRDWHTEPLLHIYSRKKRFKLLVENLFWPTPSQKDNRMLAYLAPLSPFLTKQDLLGALKQSTLADKRYCHIHFFCKQFVQDYTPPPAIPNIQQVLRRIMVRFSDIEFCFSRLFIGVQFFNYRYLLSQLLIEFQLTEYIPFVKSLKCKQRLMYYNEMLETIKDYMSQSDRFNSITPNGPF